MPGVKEVEPKARRRRSAALLTSGLPSVTGTEKRIPDVPNRESAVAATQSGSEEEFVEDKVDKDVVLAEGADDGCCSKFARYLSGLIPSKTTIRVSWSGTAQVTAQLDKKSS